MKLRKQAFVSFTCALALAGNSLTVFAQEKAKAETQTQVERKVIVKTADGQTQEIKVEGDGGTFVTPDGKKVQVRFSSNQDGTVQTGQVKTVTTQDGKEVKVVTSQSGGGQFVVTPGPGGTATFYSQDGAIHNLDGQNFTFARGGNGQDFTLQLRFVGNEF